MKFKTTNERNVLAVVGAENCDTDAWPLVPEVVFRRYQGTFDPEMGAVAAAILFASHCGAVAEFEGVKVGIDAARAIRRVAPEIDEVLPIDGRKREISQGSRSIVVVEAAAAFDGDRRPGPAGRSARAVSWSGDCVPRGKRNSADYVCGEIFTNAELVSRSTGVSVALGLLLGGRSLRDIYVAPPPRSEKDDLDRISDGLECLGIKVRTL